MKNKKTFYIAAVVVLVVGILLSFLFKPMTMKDIYNEPNFTGVVTKVYDTSILVSVDEDEDEIRSSDKIIVPLDVELKDSATNFKVGDKVRVFYDGSIAEIYPAGLHTVYAIFKVNE